MNSEVSIDSQERALSFQSLFVGTYKELFHFRYLIWALIKREYYFKYLRSPIGILWVIGSAALMISGLWIVFKGWFQESVNFYPLYLMTGWILWTLYAQCCHQGKEALLEGHRVFDKTYTNPLIFPLAKMSILIGDFLMYLALILGASLLLKAPIHFHPINALIFLMSFLPFAFGLICVLSLTQFFFKDFKNLLDVLLQFQFFLTPIFYHINDSSENMKYLISWNPIYPFLLVFRSIFLEEIALGSEQILHLATYSLISFLIGSSLVVFMRRKLALWV